MDVAIRRSTLFTPTSTLHRRVLQWTAAAVLFALVMAPVSAEVVNLNTADTVALQHYLSGIGAVKADAIVAYRSKHGPFGTIDELTKVPGVGKGLLERNRANLSLDSGVSRVTLSPGGARGKEPTQPRLTRSPSAQKAK